MKKLFIIVDDDPLNNQLCRLILNKTFTDCDILTFEDPNSGLNYIQVLLLNSEMPFDPILFLDINMPGMSGWEFLEKYCATVESNTDKLKIYIVSSSIDPDDQKKASAHPMVTGYLSKPLYQDQLRNLFSD